MKNPKTIFNKIIIFNIAIMLSVFTVLPTKALASDTTPPSLQLFTITPTSVDVTYSPAVITAFVLASDQTGIQSISVGIKSPGERASYEVLCSPSNAGLTRTFCSSPIIVEQGSPSGSWEIFIRLIDTLGNTRVISASELNSMGYPNTVTVTSPNASNNTPPSLKSLSFLPSSVDVTNSPSLLLGTAQVSDDNGVASVAISVTSPDNSVTYNVQCSLSFGGQKEIICNSPIIINRGDPEGDWSVSVSLMDVFKNVDYLDSTELSSLGFPNSVRVISSN